MKPYAERVAELESVAVEIDARELKAGDLYGFAFGWREVIEARQIVSDAAGFRVPATHVLHATLDHSMHAEATFPHGCKVKLARNL